MYTATSIYWWYCRLYINKTNTLIKDIYLAPKKPLSIVPCELYNQSHNGGVNFY